MRPGTLIYKADYFSGFLVVKKLNEIIVKFLNYPLKFHCTYEIIYIRNGGSNI